MDTDGTQAGYDISMTRAIADAVLVASIAHYGKCSIRQMKEFIGNNSYRTPLLQHQRRMAGEQGRIGKVGGEEPEEVLGGEVQLLVCLLFAKGLIAAETAESEETQESRLRQPCTGTPRDSKEIHAQHFLCSRHITCDY
jgi:hypothetical protein